MMSVQNPYNLLNRTYEVGLAEISIREQSWIISLLSIGVVDILTGKYRNNKLPKNLECNYLKILTDIKMKMVKKQLMNITKFQKNII